MTSVYSVCRGGYRARNKEDDTRKNEQGIQLNEEYEEIFREGEHTERSENA
jgi:hypothetical protein